MHKRALDLVVAVPVLVLSLPLLVPIAAAIRLSMGSPVLFRQVRTGYRGERFVLYKFRSMRNPTARAGEGADDAQRLTRLGRWLRATSLDELPTLWNVVRGEMSLVGPRPLLPEYLLMYSPEQARRHEVPPGITGWAQVNGRNALSWEDKFRLDVWYVDHRSFWLDLKILLRTVRKVIAREGISQQGHVTMERFRGRAR